MQEMFILQKNFDINNFINPMKFVKSKYNKFYITPKYQKNEQEINCKILTSSLKITSNFVVLQDDIFNILQIPINEWITNDDNSTNKYNSNELSYNSQNLYQIMKSIDDITLDKIKQQNITIDDIQLQNVIYNKIVKKTLQTDNYIDKLNDKRKHINVLILNNLKVRHNITGDMVDEIVTSIERLQELLSLGKIIKFVLHISLLSIHKVRTIETTIIQYKMEYRISCNLINILL